MKVENRSTQDLRLADTSSAYIFYRPYLKGVKTKIFYNEEAKIALFPPAPGAEKVSIHKILSLCEKWRKSLERMREGISGNPREKAKWKGQIDILQSWRRKYIVRGIVLTGEEPFHKKEETRYLFILERLNPKSLNISESLKKWNLNRREQEIVRLIINDFGNKEIASHLGISIHTVKAYLKLLMRKLGVHTRAGLISTLLTSSEEK